MPTYAQLAVTYPTMASYTASGLKVGEIDGTGVNRVPLRIQNSTHPINQLIMYDQPLLYDDFASADAVSSVVGNWYNQNSLKIDNRVKGWGLNAALDNKRLYTGRTDISGAVFPRTVEFLYRGQETFSGFAEPDRIDKTIFQWNTTWAATNIAVKTRGLAPQGSPATISVYSSFPGPVVYYSITGQIEVNDNKWHHVAVTFESPSEYADDPEYASSLAVVTLYVDGRFEGRDGATGYEGFPTTLEFPGIHGTYNWTSIGSNTTVPSQVAHFAIHDKVIPEERLMSRFALTRSPDIRRGGNFAWTGDKWEAFLV